MAAKNPRPETVPAVRAWNGASGAFKLRDGARVVAPRPLRREAKLLARDLGIETARTPRRGDIVLTLGRRGGEEGYVLRIARRVTITAPSSTGVFYGGRTLVQLLADGSAPRGVARDRPRYRERGLMIDNGRQFFSREWLTERIEELANLKLNLLHLHFSDNQGFRLESETHPEIVSDPHLTKADVRELVKLARRHHVTIVPELDAPGHLEAALAAASGAPARRTPPARSSPTSST